MTANYYFYINGNKYRLFQNAAGWTILIDLEAFAAAVYENLSETDAATLHKYIKILLNRRIAFTIEKKTSQNHLNEKVENMTMTKKDLYDVVHEIELYLNAEENECYEKYGFIKNYSYQISLKTPGLFQMFKELFNKASDIRNDNGGFISSWEEMLEYFLDKDPVFIRGNYLCCDNNYIFTFHKDSKFS